MRVTLRSLQCDTPHTGYGKGRRLNTNDFLSQSKKVLVTLIRFICSFFSAARRTNQEALPQLSGFSARRLGRRRGLRNSLRSNSPRPFSSVFLASSPPDKGGINQSFFRFYSTFFFNPSVLRTPPLYLALPNTGEVGEIQYFCSTVVSTPSPYGHSPYIPCRNTGGED